MMILWPLGKSIWTLSISEGQLMLMGLTVASRSALIAIRTPPPFFLNFLGSLISGGWVFELRSALKMV